MGRIRDAVRTLLTGSPSIHEARFLRLEAEARVLITELGDTLEKLSAWSAREAKRRSRSSRGSLAQLAEEGEAVRSQALPDEIPQDPEGRAEWKARIRAGMGFYTMPRGGSE